jgi:HAE1 family hydrophobic/amphiphilic exporter-1
MLREMPDVKGAVTDMSPLGGMARNEDVQLVVQGPEIRTIDRCSRQIMDQLVQRHGFVGITRDLELGKPEVRVHIDREKAADAGVRVQAIAAAIGALLGGQDLTPATYKEGGKSYDIRLRLAHEERLLPQDVQKIWVRGNNGQVVDIGNFVRLETGVGPNVINRMDRQRSATVYANLEGILMADAMEAVATIAEKILPEGYTYKFTGRAEAFSETIGYIAFAFILSTILTYLVLAAQFESFIQPFSIMAGLPLSFIGAFGLLLLLNNTLNLFSMIAMVLLVGLVTKNGILLVDYTNQLRRTGMSVHEALVQAGATRLRPILMTAVSTIAGVLPVALGIGVGSESRQPLAVAIAGGMISSTFLTLGVVPVIYSCLEQAAQWRILGKVKEKVMAEEDQAKAGSR